MRVMMAVLALSVPAQAITLGQVDTFQSGIAGWGAFSGALTVNPDGGPTGAGDAYLLNSSDFYLSIVNREQQWAGDYLAAGVDAIEADLVNCGPSELNIRVVLGGSFTSTQAFVLPADGSWHHARFGLTEADLTWVGGGSGNLADTLVDVHTLVLRHQSGSPGTTPTPVSGSFGIDNVRAVPEPNALAVILIPSLLLFRRIRSPH